MIDSVHSGRYESCNGRRPAGRRKRDNTSEKALMPGASVVGAVEALRCHGGILAYSLVAISTTVLAPQPPFPPTFTITITIHLTSQWLLLSLVPVPSQTAPSVNRGTLPLIPSTLHQQPPLFQPSALPTLLLPPNLPSNLSTTYVRSCTGCNRLLLFPAAEIQL